jgi:cytochrome b6-f complex iron-sulfur subunit
LEAGFFGFTTVGAGGGAATKPAPAAKADAPEAAAKPKPAAAAKAKPAAAPAADAAAAKTGVKRDTASILAAARGGSKPGPVSKAEAPPAVTARLQAAAAKPKPVAPASEPEKPAVAKAAPVMPARPTKPVAKAAAKAGEEDRRGFLEIALGSFMAVGFSALSVTGGLFTLGLARYMFPNVLAEPPSRFKVGFKEGFPSGKVETKFVPQYGVWVVNGDFQGTQQIYALKTVCTHLGCTPNWLEAEQKFKCPCHGSGFYKDGVNFEGPAPRPLERYAIRISDDGQLEIDKSRSFQEELGQWADPDSYVTA